MPEGKFVFAFRKIDTKEILFEIEVTDYYENDSYVHIKFPKASEKIFVSNLTFLRENLSLSDDCESCRSALSWASFKIYKRNIQKNIEIDIRQINRILQIWKFQSIKDKRFIEYRMIQIFFDENWCFKSTSLSINDSSLMLEKTHEFSNEDSKEAWSKYHFLNHQATDIYEKFLREQEKLLMEQNKIKKEEERLQISERVKNGEGLYAVFIVIYDREFFRGVVLKKYNDDGDLEWSDDRSEDDYDYRHSFGPDTLQRCLEHKETVALIWKDHNRNVSDEKESSRQDENEGRIYRSLGGN